MTSAIPSRRKRKLIATILSDPYRKLAAIALAFGLWYFLNDQITRSIPVDMALTHGAQTASATNANRIRILLAGNVLGTGFSASGEPLGRVEIMLTGQSADIDRVEGDALELTVDFTRITDWSSRDYVEFEASDIQGVRNLEIEMKPPVVRLDVQEVTELPIPIRLDGVDLTVDDADLEDRLRRDTATFAPETARVIGPARSIEALERQMANRTPPFKATISGARNTRRDLSVVLQLNAPANSGLRLERDPVMTIRIDPKTEVFDLEVELIIDDLALPENLRGKYLPTDDGALRRVSINAGGALLSHLTTLQEQGEAALNEWARRHLRLNIWVQAFDVARTPPDELPAEASLQLQGPLQARVDRADFSLAEPIPITLRRR